MFSPVQLVLLRRCNPSNDAMSGSTTIRAVQESLLSLVTKCAHFTFTCEMSYDHLVLAQIALSNILNLMCSFYCNLCVIFELCLYLARVYHMYLNVMFASGL